MSAVTAQAASIDLALLDELKTSPELWSDRDEEAVAIAQHLLRTPAPIVVLHGPPRSGKTELIRRRVIPILAESRRVLWRGGAESAGDAGAGDGREGETIEFWDRFDVCLADDSASRDEVIRDVSRRAFDGRRGCRLVLIVSDDALSRLFHLCAAIPQIVEDIREIPPLATRPLFDRLARAAARFDVRITEDFFTALKGDLAAEKASLSSDLVAILAFELSRSKPSDNEATAQYYEGRGRLSGLLEAHLDFLFEQLPDRADSQVAWAVLQEIARPATCKQPVDLGDIANRFDVPIETPEQILRWLDGTRRIVQRRPAGGYDLVPPQLMLAADARQQREAIADEHSRWVLRQAVRHYVEAEALLSEQSFKRLHAHRSALRVSDEEAKLMLRCAIACEDTVPGATRYWLRRIEDPDVKVDILLEAVFDSRPGVRRRAAISLSAFPRPDVRNQLHLLALRDPNDDVRAEAIESLNVIKDDDLRTSLIQELRQPKSPYRLQAIDALRIYDDPAAIDALVRIVRTNEAGKDAEARRRAIDVLGRQQTREAVDALLEAALHDRDAEDREGAARALGSISREDTLRFLLDRLRELRTTATAWRLSLSPTSAALSLVNILLAMGVVLASLFVPGCVLLTLRRRRLAIGLTLLGLAGIVMAGLSFRPGLGLGLFAVSLAVGLLLPTRMLVVERLDGKPQSGYRRALGIVLFGLCAIISIYCHGLACMLGKRVRRGLVLIGFEILGIFLVLGAIYVDGEFAAFAPLSPVFSMVSTSFALMGALVLATTYIVGIWSVWPDAFVLRARRESLRRIDAILNELSRNRAVPALLLKDCVSGPRAIVRWSGAILRKAGQEVRTALRDCWAQADPPTRRKIFSLLARRHDLESIPFLRTAARSLGWRARAEYVWANLAFRMSVWPKALLIAVAVVLYVQLGALAVFYAQMVHQPDALEAVVRDAKKSVDDRTQAVNGLRQLALAQEQSHGIASAAAASLVGIMTDQRFAQTDEKVRAEVLSAASAVAVQFEERPKLVDAFVHLLGVPETQNAAVEGLEQVGTAEAVARLREFVELPIQASRRAKENPAVRATDDLAIKKAAIGALAAIGGDGPEPLEALMALSTNEVLTSELKDAAARAVESYDRLHRAEYFLAGQWFDHAIGDANLVLAERPQDEARARRARQVLTRAHATQGWIAFRRQAYDIAKSSLVAAADPAVFAGGGSDLFDLGLNLAYVYHEEMQAYADTYDVLSRLRVLEGDRAVKSSVEVNFAEVNLTTGRYAEAVPIARNVLASDSVKADTSLNMKFVVYAALALSRRLAEAAQARQKLLDDYRSLPAGFTNDWAYTGTRKYIQNAALPASEKSRLLDALALIERPK